MLGHEIETYRGLELERPTATCPHDLATYLPTYLLRCAAHYPRARLLRLADRIENKQTNVNDCPSILVPRSRKQLLPRLNVNARQPMPRDHTMLKHCTRYSTYTSAPCLLRRELDGEACDGDDPLLP